MLIIKHFQKEVFFCRKIVVRIVGGFKNSHYFCRENPRDAEILSTDISLQIFSLRRLRLNSRNAPFVPYNSHNLIPFSLSYHVLTPSHHHQAQWEA